MSSCYGLGPSAALSRDVDVAGAAVIVPPVGGPFHTGLRQRTYSVRRLLAPVTRQVRYGSSSAKRVEQTERIVTSAKTGSILDPDVLDAIQKALASAPRGHGLTVR